jgi:hypothetical protein
MNGGKKSYKVNAVALAKLLAALRDGPCTYWELHDATGLHYNTLRNYINAMRREKLLYVCEWEKDRFNRDMLAVFAWGDGKDKKKQKMTVAQRKARHRARQRQGLIGTLPNPLGPPSLKRTFTEKAHERGIQGRSDAARVEREQPAGADGNLPVRRTAGRTSAQTVHRQGRKTSRPAVRVRAVPVER